MDPLGVVGFMLVPSSCCAVVLLLACESRIKADERVLTWQGFDGRGVSGA